MSVSPVKALQTRTLFDLLVSSLPETMRVPPGDQLAVFTGRVCPHKRELKGKSPREFSRVNRRRWSPLGGQPSSCGAGLMGANAWTASQIALQIWGTDPHALG